MPTDNAARAHPGWGGARPGAGMSGPQNRIIELNDLRDRKDVTGAKSPKAIQVMRTRMNYHLWQMSIYQKPMRDAEAIIADERQPAHQRDNARNQYKAAQAEFERHLAAADETARYLARFETPMLSATKSIPADGEFPGSDDDLGSLSDDGLATLVQQLGALVPAAANGNADHAAGNGDNNQGGPAPVA